MVAYLPPSDEFPPYKIKVCHLKHRRDMELKDYIQKRGEGALAEELGVSIDTIRSWRYGSRQPSVNQAKKLIKLTGHALDWESIYGKVES
jgi:transcriptional regulator with XRE-family HTH domain|tara:strand:+ start:778 stop:1047 length:270 start_codon:yes stop_codon:yes gene_type:complete